MSIPVRPDLSEENLRQLLAQGHETETLDYKSECNPAVNDEFLELTKDVAAMLMKGGFIVVGSDDHGKIVKSVPAEQVRIYEQASLRSKLGKYLSGPFDVRSKVHQIDDQTVVLIYVGEHPSCLAVIHTQGQNSKNVVLFRPGDVMARHGTASERWNQHDIAEVEQRIVARLKSAWMVEASNVFEAQVPKIAAGLRAGLPVGALTWELDTDTFHSMVIELIREKDYAPIRLLTNRIRAELRKLLAEADPMPRFETVLDHLACVGAAAIEMQDMTAFEISVSGLFQAYEVPIGPQGHVTIYRTQASALIWLNVIRRVCALGALAVRFRLWEPVSKLVSVRSAAGDYERYRNWFRHAVTMAARSDLLLESRDGRQASTTLISHALRTIDSVACLRPDALPEDETILNSLCQFDFMVCIATISQGLPANDGNFYPNFARYYSERATPAARMIIEDENLRQLLFPHDDDALANALRAVDVMAHQEGALFQGWRGFREAGDGIVSGFLETHSDHR